MLGPVRFVARIVGWIGGTVATAVVLAAGFGRLGGVIGGAFAVVATLWLWLWLPRTAHAAFEAGKYAPAARRYRVLGALAGSAYRERASLLSRAGCYVAAGELEAAERLLQRIGSVGDLDAAERAVWLNNRACASLAAGADPHAALALVDEATALRPDVAAVQHTRGMALLAVGRIDDAIAVLDGMRAGGELSPRLEADRCRDLARAWTQKGETAYAEDYRMRAEALRR
jgi:predicted Zn-dependent protease